MNLIRECIDANGRACWGADTHPKVSWMNIHVCISYASLQQTAGKHLARMLMKQTNSPSSPPSLPPSLPAAPSYCSTWQCIVSSPHSHHQPCSLNITICLIVPSNFPSSHPLPLSLHYFCSSTPPSPPSPLSWGYWPTWQALMISPVYVGPPVPGWPRCLLIILSSAQPEALSTSNLLPFYQTNLLTCCFLHLLETITT